MKEKTPAADNTPDMFDPDIGAMQAMDDGDEVAAMQAWGRTRKRYHRALRELAGIEDTMIRHPNPPSPDGSLERPENLFPSEEGKGG